MTDNLITLQKSLQELNLQDLSKSIKISHVLKFAEMKRNNPQQTKESICKGIGITPNRLNKYLDEFGVTGFQKKYTKSQKRAPTTSQNDIKKSKPIRAGGGEENFNLIRNINI